MYGANVQEEIDQQEQARGPLQGVRRHAGELTAVFAHLNRECTHSF
jgi:hypothetical protein